MGGGGGAGKGGSRDIGEKVRGGRFRGKQEEREEGIRGVGIRKGEGVRSGENWDKVPNPVRIILKSRSPV